MPLSTILKLSKTKTETINVLENRIQRIELSQSGVRGGVDTERLEGDRDQNNHKSRWTEEILSKYNVMQTIC